RPCVARSQAATRSAAGGSAPCFAAAGGFDARPHADSPGIRAKAHSSTKLRGVKGVIDQPSGLTGSLSTRRAYLSGMVTQESVVAELQAEIKELARERNAVILAHNYERAEVQDVADFVGDSLGLSREAAKTDAEMIVF